MLQNTNVVAPRDMQINFDSMDMSVTRITIKSQAVRMPWQVDGQDYI